MVEVGLKLFGSEVAYLANTLNEVLNGFEPDYEAPRTSDWRTKAKDLMGRLSVIIEFFTSGLASVSLSEPDLRLLLWSSEACLAAFDPLEFETRLGETVLNGRRISQRLLAATTERENAGETADGVR